jgi:CheY-like chemotaxis protein
MVLKHPAPDFSTMGVITSPTVDLVFMDIDLGSGIDGTEATRQIFTVRNLPIVFLTSHSDLDELAVTAIKNTERLFGC